MKRRFRHLALLVIAATAAGRICVWTTWDTSDRSSNVSAATDPSAESDTSALDVVTTSTRMSSVAVSQGAASDLTEQNSVSRSEEIANDTSEPKDGSEDVTFVQVVGDTKTQKATSTRRQPSQTGKKAVEVRLSSEAQLAKGEINFDDLKFDIEKDSTFDPKMWTPRLKKISGKKVKLSGYILPSTLFQEKGIKQFILVRDNQECCFGPGAALFDCVVVNMVDGTSTDFTTRPVTVEGKFHLDDKTYRHPGGKGPGGSSHMAVFRMDGMKVK